jgi:acylphosphatase
MSGERRRVTLRIRGHVQGVWFRESARQEAERLGVCGWIRNMREGDVEATAEGPVDAVEAFVRWCHRGPPAARVSAVDRADSSATGEFTRFDVRR